MQLRNIILVPHLPPLPLEYRTLFRRRILHPLRIPLVHRQRSLDRQQILHRPKLRPTRLTTRHDRWELKNLPLIGPRIFGLISQYLPSQIHLRPSRHNQQYLAPWLQTLTRSRRIPLIRLLHRRLTHRILLRMRVVNYQKVRTTPRHRTTNTSSKILPTLVRLPPTSSLTVRRQHRVRENLLVRLRIHQVTYLPTKPHSQLTRVRRLNDLGRRLAAHEPRQKEIRR